MSSLDSQLLRPSIIPLYIHVILPLRIHTYPHHSPRTCATAKLPRHPTATPHTFLVPIATATRLAHLHPFYLRPSTSPLLSYPFYFTPYISPFQVTYHSLHTSHLYSPHTICTRFSYTPPSPVAGPSSTPTHTIFLPTPHLITHLIHISIHYSNPFQTLLQPYHSLHI